AKSPAGGSRDGAGRRGPLRGGGWGGDGNKTAMMGGLWRGRGVGLGPPRRWKTRVELANAIFEYIEIFHNRRRRHSSLGMLTPIEFELKNINTTPMAA